MAKLEFQIPSLFSARIWDIQFDGINGEWKQFWKLWNEDKLIGGMEKTRSIFIGKPEIVGGKAYPNQFEVPLGHSITHHERPDIDNFHRNLYRIWIFPRSDKAKLEYGIYPIKERQELWLQLLPSAHGLRYADYVEFPHVAGLAPNRFETGDPVTEFESHAFFHVLEKKSEQGPAQPWYIISRTQFLQDSRPVYAPKTAFDALNLALRETRGTQFSSQPFHGFVPSFHPEASNFDPISLISLPDRTRGNLRMWGTRLLRIDLGDQADGKELDARFDWYYSDRDGSSDARTGFTLRGKIKSDDSEQFRRKWGADGTEVFQTFEAILKTWQIEEDEWQKDKNKNKPPNIAKFELDDCRVLDTGWLRLGSLEIQPIYVEDPNCTLSFRASGHLGTGATGIYPIVTLKNLACRVRNASGADPRREVANADGVDNEIDILRRETTPIVGKVDDANYRNAVLEVTTTYEWGRDAHTEIILDVDMSDSHKGSAVWLNLRPFMAALVDYAKPDDSRLKIVWNSDDVDGAQWRVDNPSVLVVLPPQSVGEEMERGDRFYEVQNTPDIKPGGPVQYRFSRGTYLKLKPSPRIENRRYEISPINFREIMRDSSIESMIVEMAYPLEVEYVRRDTSRDLRLVEAGESFGKPAQTIMKKDQGDDNEFSDGAGLSEELKKFLVALPLPAQNSYSTVLSSLQYKQFGVQVNFQSRLAELHVEDTLRHRKDLRLGGDDIVSHLRHTEQGAMPLIFPLPNDSLYTPNPNIKKDFHKFLINDDWAKSANAKKSIRGGLVHSFEYASELEEVLNKAESVGSRIESLTLSALGATGRMEASFANGKTSFAVVVEHGQLSRLVKTRIGRIGALWNRAKHVVVYERSAARSVQFEDEQEHTDAFDRWPILRKMEEYVEPIEDRRDFYKEAQKDANTTRFIQASVFETKRIYVNGAWAHDLGVGQGYELPLWDRTSARSNPRFYPRPSIFLDCHGEEGRMTRLWFRDPDRIFFFSTAEEGTSDDTDKWNQRAGVDFENMPRMPVIEEATAEEGRSRMAPRTPANRELCTSLRFDLAVEAEGPVDLAFGSGSAPQLVKVDRVFISRSSQTTPVALKRVQAEPGLAQAIAAVKNTGTAQKSAANLAPSIADLSTKLRDHIEREIYKFKGLTGGNPCDEIFKEKLTKIVDEAITEFQNSLDPTTHLNLSEQIQRTRSTWLASAAEVNKQLQSRALLAEHVFQERVKTLAESLDKLYAKVPNDLNPLPPEVYKLRDAFISEARALHLDLQQRSDDQLAKVSEDIRNALTETTTELNNAITYLNTSTRIFDDHYHAACVSLAKAIAQIEKLPPSTGKLADPVANWLRFLSEQLATLADQKDYLVRLAPNVVAEIVKKLNKLAEEVLVVANAVQKWSTEKLKDAADKVVGEVNAIANGIETDLNLIIYSNANGKDLREAIMKLRVRLQGAGDNVLAQHRRAASILHTKLEEAAGSIADALVDPTSNPLKKVATACTDASKKIRELGNALRVKMHDVINQGTEQCNGLIGRIQEELKEAEQWARRQADAALTEVLSSEASLRMAQYAQTATQVWDVGSKAASLARAVGECPNLHPLKFDIDIAAYVFDGKKPDIMMTPAIARLQQGGEALLESLGISIPCKELRDRIIPDFTPEFDFNEIFNKFAGMDLHDLFKKFKLPSLNSDKVKVNHGFDPKTRRAWANAKVDFAHSSYEELFAFGPVSLGLQKMKFEAFTGIDTTVVNTTVQTPTCKTTASLRADWLLQGAGQAMVTFKDVAIIYDGADGFNFDVSPDNIELHPSLKFITEIVEKLQEKLPPAVQIEMKNGWPVGVSAGTTIVVDKPPDLGAVSIGPIDIRSSLALLVDDGRFSIQSAFSLGSKQKPIFVQITWMGGGCWLEARAKYVDGRVTPSMSIGLAVGATRAFNLASVAKGSFSVLLYCYIEIEQNNNSVAIGLSITGSALIIGFVNANVSLLLEAKHSKGKTEGTGRLDVSVKISWFYTFRFKQAVKHKF